MDLSNNQIRDVTPLVRNTGVDEGDRVDLRGNPLNPGASEMIKELRARGVLVVAPGDDR